MLIYIEILFLCNLVIKDLDEHDFNDFFFEMNTKTKYDEIDFFERENK